MNNVNYKCIESSPNGIGMMIRKNQCRDHEECVVHGDGQGFCLPKIQEDLKILYPGEYCDILEEVTYCAYGPQKYSCIIQMRYGHEKMCRIWIWRAVQESCRLQPRTVL